MSDPVRMPKATLAALEQACAAHPSQRVMQVIVNALNTDDPFYVEDKDAALKLVQYAQRGRWEAPCR